MTRLTKQGKWFMKAFVNNVVEDGDYELAVFHDLLASVEKHGNYRAFEGAAEQIRAAKFFGLVI